MQIKSNFRDRFADWVESVGGQNAAARLMNVGQSTVFSILSGTSPRQTTLEKIIEASGLGGAYWLDGFMEAGVSVKLTDKLVSIPILSAVASAGGGTLNHQEETIGELPFDRATLQRIGASLKDVHMIKVVGDSMEPTIQNGNLVMIDTSKRRHGQDGIYAIRSGQGEEIEARIKRLRYGATTGVEIISDNPAYPVESVPDRRDISLIGRAIWTERLL